MTLVVSRGVVRVCVNGKALLTVPGRDSLRDRIAAASAAVARLQEGNFSLEEAEDLIDQALCLAKCN